MNKKQLPQKPETNLKIGNKVFVTKYALTDGMVEDEVADTNISTVTKIEYAYTKKYGRFAMFRVGYEVFLDKDAAIARAEEMRLRKIKNLKKQIEKLERLSFS